MDNKGQINMVGVGILAIVGVITVTIFAEVYDGLNKSKISTSAENLLNLTDLLVAAVLIVGIVSFLALSAR